MANPMEVLPAPLSPVRAKVVPRFSDRETLLTALTIPSGVLNSTLRFSRRRRMSSTGTGLSSVLGCLGRPSAGGALAVPIIFAVAG